VGEGMAPGLPQRIREGEFVEMCELIPEFWLAKEEDGTVKAERQRQPRRVMDILTWVQSFAIYVSVRATHDSSMIAELMTYMYMIVRASQDFGGTSWVNYDTVFRRQAAAMGATAWPRVNGSLHHICFNGPHREAQRCELCLASSHSTEDCALGGPEHECSNRLRALESAVWSLSSRQTIQTTPTSTSCATIRSGVQCLESAGLPFSSVPTYPYMQQLWQQPPGSTVSYSKSRTSSRWRRGMVSSVLNGDMFQALMIMI